MIRLVDLRVDYEDVTAVADLDLEIPPGEVFGLIGPNGAGKTSTFSVLATLLEPTYGEVYIDGIDIAEHPEQVRSIIGYMPDMPPVYDELKVREFLDLFGAAHGLGPSVRRQRIDACIEQVGLTGKREAMCQGLSRGMKQRLALAKTMLHEPKVLILDEPASGLDPLARIDLRNSLRSYSAAGGTVIISSHILTELSDMCTSVGIMEAGRLVLGGRIDQITAQLRANRRLVVELAGEADGHVERIAAIAGVVQVEAEAGQRLVVDLAGDEQAVVALLGKLVRAEVPVKGYYEQRMSLEDILVNSNARRVT